MKRVGLALGGGGARGLCHIDFCKVLDDLGIKPVIISGTSIGAIIGAFYAAGFSGRDMEHQLHDLSILKLPRLVDFKLLPTSALIKGRRMSAFFRSTLGCDSFESLEIPLKIVAADFWERSQVIFEKGALIPAIRASMSVPVIFEPVRYENRVLIDGGVCNPVPFDIIRNQCDYLISIDVCGTIKQHSRHKPRMFDSIMNSFESMQCTIAAEKLTRCSVDCYVRPELENIGILEFYREKEIRKSVVLDVVDFKKKIAREVLGESI